MFQVYKQTKELFIKSFIHYMAWGESPQWWGNELTQEQKKEEIAEERKFLQEMVKDGILDGKDLIHLRKIIRQESKKNLQLLWKELFEQSWYEIHTQDSFEFFQRLYKITYQKESGILWWENGKVKVKNEAWEKIYQTVSSLLVWENGNIYIFVSATSTNTSTVIEDGVLKKQKTSKTNGIWLWENDNEVDKNTIRRSEITTIYEEYLKELEKIYQAYELNNATWKNKIKEILENVKNNKKWFIESQTNSNQTIDKIKTNFEQKIKIMKDHFKTNNWRSVEAVNNSQETPEANADAGNEAPASTPSTGATVAPADTPVDAVAPAGNGTPSPTPAKRVKPTFDKTKINLYIQESFQDKNNPTKDEMIRVIDNALAKLSTDKSFRWTPTEHQIYYIIQKQLDAQEIDGIRWPETNRLIEKFNRDNQIPWNTNVIGTWFLTKLKEVINGEQITTQERPEPKEQTEQVQQQPETQTQTDKNLEARLKDKIIDNILKSEDYNYRTLVLEAINDGSLSNMTQEQKAFIRKLKLHKEHSKIRDYLNDVEVNVNNWKLEVGFRFDSDGNDDSATIRLDINNWDVNSLEFINKFKQAITKLYNAFDINNPKARILQNTIEL